MAGKKEKPGNGENSTRVAVDPSAVGPIISDLLELMEIDLVEARSRMADLGGHLANSKLGQHHQLLEKQMDNFYIPAATDTLKAIVKELNLSLGEDG